MSSNSNTPEMNLAWDNDTGQFDVDVIRNQYSNYGNDDLSIDSRGILALESLERANRSDSVQLSAAVSNLPVLGKVISSVSILPCGTLSANPTGADSSRPLHYAHSSLFQNVFKESGSLAEALQAVLMVVQQMQYYDPAPPPTSSIEWSSPASYVMVKDKAIPVQWLGFSIVAGMIGVHFGLVFVTTVLFLALTNASWIGNAWMSISQVVSDETEGIIQKSTRKDDSKVNKMIKEGKSASQVGLRSRVRIKRNAANGRHEASSS